MAARWSQKLLARVSVTLMCAATVVVLAACGSDDGSSEDASTTAAGASPAVEQAAEAVKVAREPMAKFPGPTESPGTPPAGKKLAIVQLLPAPFITNEVKSAKEAAEAVGWTTRTYNAGGTPQGIESAMSSALTSKPDAIVLATMPLALMQPAMKKAAAEGIPVVSMTPGLPEDKPDPAKYNVVNVVNYDEGKVGTTLGQWVVQDSPTGGRVIALTSPEFASLQRMSDNFQKAVKGAGDDFKVDAVVNSPVTDVGGGQTGVARLASPMRKYAKADYMFINSENWFPTFLQASKQAGRPVTGLGGDGDSSVPLVADGAPIVMMGSDAKTHGWYGVDALIRYFNKKQQPVYDVPTQLVDSKNAKSIKGPGITVTYDNAAEWKKLWGVQ